MSITEKFAGSVCESFIFFSLCKWSKLINKSVFSIQGFSSEWSSFVLLNNSGKVISGSKFWESL